MSEQNGGVRVQTRGAVVEIAIDRPATMNALTAEINRALLAALAAAAADTRLRCVILTGTGGHFCAGIDVRELSETRGSETVVAAERRLREEFHGLVRALRALDKPTLALVDGAAVGFGCDLALACDLRIGTERARLGELFVRRGLMPDGGGTWTLPRLVGVAKALELIWTGALVTSEEGLRLGLLNRVVPSADAEAATWAFAEELAAAAPLAVARIKRAVYAGFGGGFDAALDREAEGQLALLQSEDFAEGLAAFFEKRPPRFQGR